MNLQDVNMHVFRVSIGLRIYKKININILNDIIVSMPKTYLESFEVSELTRYQTSILTS